MATRLQLQHGLSLIELLVYGLITGLLLVSAVPLGQDFYQKNRVTTAADALEAAIHYARNKALISNKALALAPLDGESWSSGMVLFEDNRAHRFRPGDLSLHEWAWHYEGLDIRWHGFQSHAYLVFAPQLRHASANGKFTIYSPSYQKTLVLNRLGHVHE